MPKIFSKFERGYVPTGRQIQVEKVEVGEFRQITRRISKTVQDRRIVSTKDNRKSYAHYRMVTLPMTLGYP